jgi:hypothetical protein
MRSSTPRARPPPSARRRTLLPQSNAILWFLGEGTAFLPSDRLQQAQVLRWLLFEQEYVISGIGAARFCILTGRDPTSSPHRLQVATSALTMLGFMDDLVSYPDNACAGTSRSIYDPPSDLP